MNGGNLGSFLHKLSEDSELQQAYMKDPRGTMQQAGLSDEEIDAMMSRDLGRIKSVLAREGGPEITLLMVLTEPGA
jgi:aromatic-ring opening dioxygenase LigAB LigA subunit